MKSQHSNKNFLYGMARTSCDRLGLGATSSTSALRLRACSCLWSKGHSDVVCRLRSVEGFTRSGRLPLRKALAPAVCHFQRCVGRPAPSLSGKTAGQRKPTRAQASFSCSCLAAFCFASASGERGRRRSRAKSSKDCSMMRKDVWHLLVALRLRKEEKPPRYTSDY